MKKIIIVITLFFVVSAYLYSDKNSPFYAKLNIGIDIGGKHTIYEDDYEFEESVKNGITSNIEIPLLWGDNYYSGFGVGYQLPREKKYGKGDFNFVPFYFYIDFMPIKNLNKYKLKPFLIAKLGYNLFFGDKYYEGTNLPGEVDLSGGIYYGCGLGFLVGKYFSLECIYSTNKGKKKFSGIFSGRTNIEYSKFSTYLGVRIR